MPGFTLKSMTPVLWQKTNDTTYTSLLDILIDYALEHYNKRNSLIYTREEKNDKKKVI
jgi:D-alanine-D-alanine ligase